MEIKFHETRADLKLAERLRSPGLSITWLVFAVLCGTMGGVIVLAALGFWRASLVLVVFLVLFVWMRLQNRSASKLASDERKLRLTDGYFEQACRGELHQTAWAMRLELHSRAKCWILRRERLAIAVIPRRAVSTEEAAELEAKFAKLTRSHQSLDDASPVPLWHDAQAQNFRFSVKHNLAPEDLQADSFQKYVPAGSTPYPGGPQPAAAPSQRGGITCLLAILILGVIIAFSSLPNAFGMEFAAGLVAIGLGIVLPAVLFFLAQRIVMKKYFADSPSFFNHEQIVALDQGGVWQGSPHGFSFIPWTSFQGVMIGTKRLVGLQHKSNLVYVVLKTSFASDEEMRSFLDFAAERIEYAGAPIIDAVLADLPPDSGNPYQPPSRS